MALKLLKIHQFICVSQLNSSDNWFSRGLSAQNTLPRTFSRFLMMPPYPCLFTWYHDKSIYHLPDHILSINKLLQHVFFICGWPPECRLIIFTLSTIRNYMLHLRLLISSYRHRKDVIGSWPLQSITQSGSSHFHTLLLQSCVHEDPWELRFLWNIEMAATCQPTLHVPQCFLYNRRHYLTKWRMHNITKSEYN